ncbi:hypothetical protein AM493_13075 [Flavobacterium akiainvivens]|uniref:Ig-like domain-containing protein n=1 Tax=Flavobacterium akiainvivens TaxID=1202724 RepID=A0A0M8MBU4_9FLAO|nr:hypothetical protein AM493_13075 [Flavobacterium akiainvivens]
MLFLFTSAGFAQSVTGNSPQKVTHRTSVTIIGTGFTSTSTVRLYTGTDYATTSTAYVLPTQTTFVSATELRIILPTVVAANTAEVTRHYRVVNGSGASATFSAERSYTYIPPYTIAGSGVTEIVTNWANGASTAWKSTSTSNNPNQPDNSHSMMGFRYGGTLYSTGNEDNITGVLNAAGYTAGATGTGSNFVTGNFRALPIKDILGSVPSSGPNLIVLASRVDGSPNTQIPTAPNVAGLTIRNVLIDGTRGLNIGTGTTNLPPTAVLTFEATNIITNNVSDGVPDIIVSQIAEPTDGSYSVYSFIDDAGNIVGRPVQVAFNSVASLGKYKSDFFTLPTGQPLNTAQINGSMLIGATTRDIRLVAYKIGDFNVTSANAVDAKKFKVMPSGTSDPAFMAYNRNRFQIPAPEITGQPASQAICPGGSTSFQVTVASTSSGTETPTFQWEKNGVPVVDVPGHIWGATTNTLTINPVNASDAGAYRCLITNTAGSALSNNAYLNTIINAGPDVTVCQTAATANIPPLEVSALGNNPVYEWYSNTVYNNTTGTLIASATTATYYPPMTVGTRYYYVKSRPSSLNNCPGAVVTSEPMEYNVVATAQGGVVTPAVQAVCPNGNAYITLSEHTGAIQWQVSSTGGASDSEWTNILQSTTTTYNTPSLYVANVGTATTYYRAKLTSNCGTATSPVAVVNTNDNFAWTGTINTDWSLAGNWSCNSIPTIATTVTIPAGTPFQPHVYGIKGFAKTITVQEGAVVTVDPAGTLEVAQAVNVAETGSFVVENNGALVQNAIDTANTGVFTVKRNSNALYRLDYTLWSSPVSGQNLVDFSPQTATGRFYEYRYGLGPEALTTNLEQYHYYANPSAISFDAARGYLIRMPNSLPAITGYNAGTATHVFPGIFTGTAHNGSYSPALTLNSVNQAGHYYAVGNPYPSPISVASFYNDTDNSSKIEAGSALYFWRKKNNSTVVSYAILTMAGLTTNSGTPGFGGEGNAQFYTGNTGGSTAYNASWIISPGQGFLVKLRETATGNVTFKNSMRVPATTTATETAGQPFFRTAQNNNAPSRYWLNFSDATGAYSQTLVAYSEEGTLGVDYGYDGYDLGEGNMRMYSVESGINFSIQARPEFNQTDVVPMGFGVATAGQYTISLNDKDGLFAEGQQIYLKDKMLGTTYNLADGDYIFNTGAGEFADRFEVVYVTDALSNPGFELNSVYVYKQNGTNTINVNSGSLELTGVKVFDIRGRELYNGAATGTEAAVSLNIAQQVVIVEVTTTTGKVSKKIIF